MIAEAIVKIVDKQDLTYEEAYTVMNEHSWRHFLPKAPKRRPLQRSPDARRQ